MKTLASIIDQIVESSQTTKTASDLSNVNSLPTISSELGVSLLKTAGLLKTASTELTYEDLADFIERAKNV